MASLTGRERLRVRYYSRMNKNGVSRRVVPAIACAVLLGGCAASGQKSDPARITTTSPVAHACYQWFDRLDRAALRTGVRDAEAAPVRGFAHLRVSRLLASYEQDVALTSQKAAWLYRMRDLDQQARRAELINMGADTANAFLRLESPADIESLIVQTRACGERLVEHDLLHPERIELIRERAHVPDAYSTTRRAIGLYPLVRPLLERADKRAGQALRKHLTDPPEASSITSSYWPRLARRGQAVATQLIASRRRDALGLPILTEEVADWLLNEYAPVLMLRPLHSNDRSGQIVIRGAPGHARPVVDRSVPTVYGRVSLTRYQGNGLVQLVYTVWLPDATDTAITSGALDGLVFRVTLNSTGEPVLFDAMQTSGRNHHFVTTGHARPRADTIAEALTPISLPVAPDGHRVRIGINTARQIDTIDFVVQSQGNKGYRIVSEDRLRSIAVNGVLTERRSLYSPSGLVEHASSAGSLLHLSSGIRRPGVARQWGHHATALGGRRHFDDAHMIDHLFTIR